MWFALFNPKGVLGSSDMLKYGALLLSVDVFLELTALLLGGPGLKALSVLFSLLVVLPWVFLWAKRYRDEGKSGFSAAWPVLTYGLLRPGVYFFSGGGKMINAVAEADRAGLGPEETQEHIYEALGDPAMLSLRVTVFLLFLSLFLLWAFNKRIDVRKNAEPVTHPWSHLTAGDNEDIVKATWREKKTLPRKTEIR